jgi:hypothetical protein
MKKFAPSIVLFVLVTFMSAQTQAKIIRLNNNPGVSPVANLVFSNTQAAHDAASAGDTIHVESSPVAYSGVTCTKKLVWLGIGQYLSANPGLQASSTPGVVGTMYFNAGSENSIASVVCNGYLYVNANNITISRSYVSYSFIVAAVSNTVITGCFCSSVSLGNASNAIVSNCIMTQTVDNAGSGSAIIINNVMNLAGAYGSTLYNSVFQNNILVKGGPFTFNNTQAVYNTTSAATGLPAGNNNVFDAVMTDYLVNPAGTNDKDYVLKIGSPAIGSGSSGSDRGAFGGPTPYVLGMQPGIPAITALSSPAALNSNTIQVIFSAKSNN